MEIEELFFGILIICAAYICILDKRSRRFSVRPINRGRTTNNMFLKRFMLIKENDHDEFFKITRMDSDLFDHLLSIIKNDLTKNSIRKPLSPEERLSLTLLYLSQGTSIQTIATMFSYGKTTIRNVILETCDVIWNNLKIDYVSEPKTNDGIEIEKVFAERWNFPNCIGAIDGKHIKLVCPDNAGSQFFNYKSTHSLVLMAICDGNYLFRAVDVGAYGSQSDGGVFANSDFGRQIVNETLSVPKEKILPNSNLKFPHYFVGDAAFPLKSNLMRPFPGRYLPEQKAIFNNRLSRARRTIENTFGILAARWRILYTTIFMNPDNVEKIVLACVALHNYIKINRSQLYTPNGYVDWTDEKNNLIPGQWRQDLQGNPLQSVGRLGSNRSTAHAFELRELLCQYVNNEGKVKWNPLDYPK